MDRCFDRIENGIEGSNVINSEVQSRCIENVRRWEIEQKRWEAEKRADEDLGECKK